MGGAEGEPGFGPGERTWLGEAEGFRGKEQRTRRRPVNESPSNRGKWTRMGAAIECSDVRTSPGLYR